MAQDFAKRSKELLNVRLWCFSREALLKVGPEQLQATPELLPEAT